MQNERVMDKLNDRAKQCIQQKRSATETKTSVNNTNPKLSHPANGQVPFIANCLQLKKTAHYGRHVVTTEDLKAGDIIAVEQAFCSSLRKEFKYKRCGNCLKENNHNLIPCKYCVSVMFCDEKCYDEGCAKFHKFECPIVDYLDQLLCESSTITFKTVIHAITSFKTVDELITFIEETEGQDFTVFDGNYEENSQNSYTPVHFLAKNYDESRDFAAHILVSLICQPLLELTELKEMFTTAKAVTILQDLILHHIKTFPMNRSFATCFDGSQLYVYGLGVYPFRNLLNHSCVPNMAISPMDDKLVFTVSKPIKAGEQLFDN